MYCHAGRLTLATACQHYKERPANTVYSDGGHLNAVGNIILADEVIKALGVTW